MVTDPSELPYPIELCGKSGAWSRRGRGGQNWKTSVVATADAFEELFREVDRLPLDSDAYVVEKLPALDSGPRLRVGPRLTQDDSMVRETA